MSIIIVEETTNIEELKNIAKEFYKTMIKGVVDIENGLTAFGGEYHIDANQKLIERGSLQSNVWGFNLYFDRSKDDWVEYISLINIRPQDNNHDMEVMDPAIRSKMKKIINSKIV